jgi:hypothetical protein
MLTGESHWQQFEPLVLMGFGLQLVKAPVWQPQLFPDIVIER